MMVIAFATIDYSLITGIMAERFSSSVCVCVSGETHARNQHSVDVYAEWVRASSDGQRQNDEITVISMEFFQSDNIAFVLV